MVWVYRHRWTGIETVHQNGKQPWELGDCQVRSGAGQIRHLSLVRAASSLLMRALQPRRAQERARWTLTTIGAACRAVNADTVARMSDGVVDTLTVEHES